MATTQKEELTQNIRRKIIELFGPESALAQAMEDPEFMDKLGDLVSYIVGEVMLTLPRPEPRYEPRPYKPEPVAPTPPSKPWEDNWLRTAGAPAKWSTGISAGDFGTYVRSVLSSGHDYKANV